MLETAKRKKLRAKHLAQSKAKEVKVDELPEKKKKV